MFEITGSHLPFKERILLLGGGGAGKSTAVLDVARHCPGQKFWVADNDTSFSYTRLLATEFSDITNRGERTDEYIDVGGYELYVQIFDNVRVVQMQPDWNEFVAFNQYVIGTWQNKRFVPGAADHDNDWIAYDSSSPLWNYVQSWFSEQVHGMDLAEMMLKLRTEAKDLKEYNKLLTSDMTWPLINREYDSKFTRYVHRWRGHIIATAIPQAFSGEESAQEREVFGKLGVKPRGQKDLFTQFGTNLLLRAEQDGWYMRTGKDRGREDQWDTGVESFAQDYLVKVGGWKLLPPKKGA